MKDQLTQKQLDEFKQLCAEQLHLDITDEEAAEYGTTVVNLVSLVIDHEKPYESHT